MSPPAPSYPPECLLVPGQFAVGYRLRTRSLGTKTLDLVLLVRLKVAFEPVPLIRVLRGAFPCQDVGCHPVKEPSVVRHYDSTTRELLKSVLQRREGFNIQVVCGLIKQQEVATLFEC